MTPDAGGSDKVSTNRGFMAIPEVGDQVMIGFQHNHPDRPFVFGGMFHGKVGAGGGTGNNIKSLSSKSGNIVKLNDAAGIEIKDRNSNFITLSGTGNLNTKISADYTENVGGNQTTNITKNHELNVDIKSIINVGEGGSKITSDKDGNIIVESTANIKLKVGCSEIEITGSSINLRSQTIQVSGGSMVSLDNSDGKICSANGINVMPGFITVKEGNVDIN